MLYQEKVKLFNDVFAPKSGEKILILVDIPHDNIDDTTKWKDRREMAREWFDTFQKMGDDTGFSVDWLEFNATGMHNAKIPKDVMDIVQKSDVVIAMTEFSASSSLIVMKDYKDNITRCASMPMVEKSMENTAFKADYLLVKKHARALQKMLNNSIGAEVTFSSGDKLYVDLRNRTAGYEAGECVKTGQFINFPSGEAWKVPYEACNDEIGQFGKSKTEGVLPVKYNGELMKFIIKNNKITEVLGKNSEAEKMRKFLEENQTRKNIAEFAIGCNQNAVVIGNILEDEKTSGLHIAYAMSSHLGGKVDSDMHEDIVYSKGCPVEALTVDLIDKDGKKIEIIRNAEVRYELLE